MVGRMQRIEAKLAGQKRYSGDRPCPHGHGFERFVSSAGCVTCHAKRRIAYHLKNKNRERKRRAAYYRKNMLVEMANRSAYKRGDHTRLATPPWVSKKDLRDVYLAAKSKRLSVDHIVPLTHPKVCGLHVPWNLKLIPLVVNISKGNKMVAESYKLARQYG